MRLTFTTLYSLMVFMLLLSIAPPAFALSSWSVTGSSSAAAAPSGTIPIGGAVIALGQSTGGGYVAWYGYGQGFGASRFNASGTVGTAASEGAAVYSAGGAQFVPGLASAPDNTLYMADAIQGKILQYSPTGIEVRRWGSAGAGDGQFGVGPTGIALAPDGTLLVSDAGNDRVQRFTSTGVYIEEYGTTGSGPGQLDYPTGIAMNPDGSFWVVDRDNDRAQLLSATGAFVAQAGASGVGPGEFDSATHITRLSNGDIVVLDSALHRAQRFDASGTYLNLVADAGAGPGQLDQAGAITALADDTILISDLQTNGVMEFQPDGTYLGVRHEWGASDMTRPLFVERVPGNTTDVFVSRMIANTGAPTLHRCTIATGVCTGVLGTPGVDYTGAIGLTLALDNTLIVGNSGAEMARLTSAGTHVNTIGAGGPGAGTFQTSFASTIAPDGTLYVLDALDGQIEHFSITGTHLGTISAPLLAGYGLAIDYLSDGSFLVLIRNTSDAQLARISSAGAIIWQKTEADGPLDGAGLIALDDGTFLSASTTLQRRSIASGDLLAQTPLPAGHGIPTLSSIARLSDGRVVGADPLNNRLLVFTETPEQVTLQPTTPPPTTISSTNPPATLTFSTTGGSGTVTYLASSDGRSIPISADGTIQTADLPEGRQTLRVTATDSIGQTSTWEQVLTVDRTAPVIASPPRFTVTRHVELSVSDAVSDPTVARRGVMAPRTGTNAIQLVVQDTVGNQTTRSVMVTRRPSLTRGPLNRALQLWRPPGNGVFTPGSTALNAVFHGRMVRTTYYTPALMREVQFRLKQLGYLSKVVHSTGRLDANTRRSLSAFQKAQSLPRTKAPDAATRAALDAALVRLR